MNVPSYFYVAEASIRYVDWPKAVAKQTALSMKHNIHFNQYFETGNEQIIMLKFNAIEPENDSDKAILEAAQANIKARKSVMMSLRDQTQAGFGKEVRCKLDKDFTKLVFYYKGKPKMKLIRKAEVTKPTSKKRKKRKPRKRF